MAHLAARLRARPSAAMLPAVEMAEQVMCHASGTASKALQRSHCVHGHRQRLQVSRVNNFQAPIDPSDNATAIHAHFKPSNACHCEVIELCAQPWSADTATCFPHGWCNASGSYTRLCPVFAELLIANVEWL